MKMKLNYKNGVSILELQGKLIGTDVSDLRSLLTTEITSAKTPCILLNLAHVSRIDSAALGLLANANLKVRQKHGRIGIVHVGRHIKNLIIQSRLLSLFEHFDTETDAITELSSETEYQYKDRHPF